MNRPKKKRPAQQDALLATMIKNKPPGGEEFWIFSLVFDDERPTWEQRYSTIGTYEQCARQIVKMTHLLLANKINRGRSFQIESYQGANARNYLADMARQEGSYREELRNQSNN